jgi:hypothetical protein
VEGVRPIQPATSSQHPVFVGQQHFRLTGWIGGTEGRIGRIAWTYQPERSKKDRRTTRIGVVIPILAHFNILIASYIDKKENQIFLIYKEILNGAVAKSYMTNGHLICIWGNICAFPHILGSPSSYMTLQLLHSEFP